MFNIINIFLECIRKICEFCISTLYNKISVHDVKKKILSDFESIDKNVQRTLMVLSYNFLSAYFRINVYILKNKSLNRLNLFIMLNVK